MKTVAYYNGTISTIDELTVPAKDRAVYFGDGIYDVAVAEQFHPFTLDDHINRFFCGIKQIQLPFAMSKDEFRALILDLLQKLDAPGNAMIYWQASRGISKSLFHHRVWQPFFTYCGSSRSFLVLFEKMFVSALFVLKCSQREVRILIQLFVSE